MMLTQRKMQYDKAGAKVAEALNKRHFDAYYCSDRAEALEKILELIPQDHVVSWAALPPWTSWASRRLCVSGARPSSTATPPRTPRSASRC